MMFYNLTNPKQTLPVVILSELILRSGVKLTENKLLNHFFFLLNYSLRGKKKVFKREQHLVRFRAPGLDLSSKKTPF